MAPDEHLEMDYEDRTYVPDDDTDNLSDWPGDGSEDDLADFNRNEAADYRDED